MTHPTGGRSFSSKLGTGWGIRNRYRLLFVCAPKAILPPLKWPLSTKDGWWLDSPIPSADMGSPCRTPAASCECVSINVTISVRLRHPANKGKLVFKRSFSRIYNDCVLRRCCYWGGVKSIWSFGCCLPSPSLPTVGLHLVARQLLMLPVKMCRFLRPVCYNHNGSSEMFSFPVPFCRLQSLTCSEMFMGCLKLFCFTIGSKFDYMHCKL